MKYYIQEALELEIERYGDPVAYVEGLWKKNVGRMVMILSTKWHIAMAFLT